MVQAGTAPAFDSVAARYDADFTTTTLGRWLREFVWQELATAFVPGDAVLELGCGTGEDALWLARRGVRVLATDVAPAMLAVAQQKATAAGLTAALDFAVLDLAAVDRAMPFPASEKVVPPLAGVFSNFGALNCLADWRPLAAALASWVRPGGKLVFVVMGRFCPWEVLTYALRGRLSTACRRLQPRVRAQVGGRDLLLTYPTPRTLAAAFAPAFVPRARCGLGVFLPPSYHAARVERWPRTFGLLHWLEARLRSTWLASQLNDHFLLVLERTPGSDA